MANRKRTSTQTLKLYTPRPILRRTRTGCLTCRKRRIKCDEQKPDCYRCQRSKKLCIWESDNKPVKNDLESQLGSFSGYINDLSDRSSDNQATTKIDSLINVGRSEKNPIRPVKSSNSMFQSGGYSIADLLTTSNSSCTYPDSNDKLPLNDHDAKSSKNASSTSN